jgi:Protein of unknown function (DUF3443)
MDRPATNTHDLYPRARGFLRLAAVAACLLLASCGGGGGGGTSSPTVSLSFAPVSVPAGQASTLTWSSTNATSCTASGAWAGNQAVSGSLAVTQAIAGTYTYTLSCTGAGGSASGSVALGVTDLTGNVAPVVVDSGPAGAGSIINVPFVSVTLCVPGTSTCQTIDHVLLDTGSYGLRIISPGVLDASLALPAVTGPSGNPVGECAPFVSFSVWGSVRRAKVQIAGETAASVPVQVVADAAFTGAPPGCSGTVGTVAALGAKGILGVGVLNQDCGPGCTTQPANGYYYECTASNCTGSTMALASQVSNPVAGFATDNNGVALVMPAVAPGGATTLTGALIFGIDTQSNNQIGPSATVYATDKSGNFTTTYNGTSGIPSFLDSGSNALLFSDSTIPLCSASNGYSGFYCPSAAFPISATNISPNGASGTVSVTIVNPQALDSTIRAASIGGSTGLGSSYFDWGLPFFFGRTVFVAISGASTARGTGPYWAY